MKHIYIYHHLGLGDHVICNGLVRTLIKKDPEAQYVMFVKSHNKPSVSFMYRDLKNLSFHTVNTDADVNAIIDNQNLEFLYVIGFGWDPSVKEHEFDKVFYLQHGLDFEERWNSFYCERDINREMELFKKFNIIENDYVFVHDDISRGFEIEEKHVRNKDLQIIRPTMGIYASSNNVFDYLYLMQHSKEAHFMESSFRLVLDSFALKADNIYHHLTLKHGKTRGPFWATSKLNFTVIRE